MATPAVTFSSLHKHLQSQSGLAPVYLLHGAEGYYIDRLVSDFEALVPEAERDFNLYVLYAPEVDPDEVVSACLRYPMMAERQVVILKEAQAVPASYMEQLAAYVAHPNPQTVLVVASRGEAAKGREFLKAVKASGGMVFESKKLYDNQVGQVLSDFVTSAGLSIDPKALEMLVAHVGTDLSRLANEVNKVTVALPAGAMVTPEAVEKLIGVSKDYNSFELIDAVARRDTATAYRIAEYFRSNPKNNPTIPVGMQLFNFFAKLLLCWYAPERTERAMMEAAGASSSFAFRRYKDGLRNFSARQTITAISATRRFDARVKGVGSRQNEYDLLRELLFTIFS